MGDIGIRGSGGMGILECREMGTWGLGTFLAMGIVGMGIWGLGGIYMWVFRQIRMLGNLGAADLGKSIFMYNFDLDKPVTKPRFRIKLDFGEFGFR